MARQYFVRFVLWKPRPGDPKIGAFEGAYELSGRIGPLDPDKETLTGLLAWFERNLKTPDRFTRTKSKGQFRAKKGLSWFKPDAIEAIRKMRELTGLLSRHEYTVEELRAVRPGFVTYEDDFQVVAEPFADTPK